MHIDVWTAYCIWYVLRSDTIQVINALFATATGDWELSRRCGMLCPSACWLLNWSELHPLVPSKCQEADACHGCCCRSRPIWCWKLSRRHGLVSQSWILAHTRNYTSLSFIRLSYPPVKRLTHLDFAVAGLALQGAGISAGCVACSGLMPYGTTPN